MHIIVVNVFNCEASSTFRNLADWLTWLTGSHLYTSAWIWILLVYLWHLRHLGHLRRLRNLRNLRHLRHPRHLVRKYYLRLIWRVGIFIWSLRDFLNKDFRFWFFIQIKPQYPLSNETSLFNSKSFFIVSGITPPAQLSFKQKYCRKWKCCLKREWNWLSNLKKVSH